MKKVLGLSIAALLLIGLVAGGTFAYFSDTESTTGNLFTTGTIDLTVRGENPWTTKLDADLTNLKPGMTGTAALTLANTGTNDIDVWMRIYDVSAQEVVTDNEPENNEPAAYDIDTVIRFISSGVGTGATGIAEGENYTISGGAPAHGLTTNAVKNAYIYVGQVAHGGSTPLVLQFKMDPSVTNWAQGDTMTFSVEFTAQQTLADAGPAGPTPQLTGHQRAGTP